jgi:ABC-type polysaccharide/polyol phosphate transport system ATPase subunit
MTHAVMCEDLWKTYQRHRAIGVKSLLLGADTPKETRFAREWALSEVGFEVPRGRSFGVIGPNGSGKTTLLSILLGTVQEDRGRVSLNGRVASLLELGAGFHGDLTGRENVFLYGSILGMRLAEIRRRFENIAEFSELEGAIEQPLRTYSAGMVARLGFSTIINSPADILLIDEVLAVGDARFQAKCQHALREFRARQGTLVIVSHNMKELTAVCDEGICLDLGRVVDAGPIAGVVARYQQRAATAGPGRPAGGAIGNR